MADAMEALGEHVDEETSDELVDGKRHSLVTRGPCRFSKPGLPARMEPSRQDDSLVNGWHHASLLMSW
jgi:hypothetical protein